ncbi:MAG: tRNA (cytosine(32)/uridine(32)-2'-O)-methyltransferase TrmJ [Gammaproteobacteria bacterium]
MLNNIRIVLVGTSHPGNIGAAARAMKTMGLSRLILVAPDRFPDPEAVALASGAEDVLRDARQVETLDQALIGCRWVAGASARQRRLSWPELDPRECAERARQEAVAGDVALVFGRERTGLTNEELDLCHHLVHIPANPEYSSLNLAAAVQVLSYELRMAGRPAAATDEHEPAPSEELERFFAHLETVLVRMEFLDPDNPRHLMRRLRRLYHRARPDRNEINILRGILTAVESRRWRNS